jgi:hypothetical protein
MPGQSPATGGSAKSSFAPQIKPDFMQSSAQNNGNSSTFSRTTRTSTDAFGQMSPQSQRAALFDQARQQMTQANQLNYQHLRNPSAALPGGLTERQRTDFKMLQRTDPAAAQKQLMNYQRTSDIRYNKPMPGAQPPAGPAYHRPPSNPTGPRPRFGA